MQAGKGFPKHGAKSDSFKAPTFIARIVFPEFQFMYNIKFVLQNRQQVNTILTLW